MTTFADGFNLPLNLPYSEYWLPLAIGMGVGVCALTVGKLVVGRKPAATGDANQRPPEDHDPFVAGSAQEQRKAYRRQGNPVEVHLMFPDQKEPSQRGWVLDRSVGGLCLQTSVPFEPGTALKTLPINAPTLTPWVEIEVRSCRAVQDGFELGCQFIKTPSYSILLMFG